MDVLYAWLLAFFLSPAAASSLPADTFELVDPTDPLDSSLFVDAVFEDIPPGIVTDLCLVESGGCKRPVGIHKGDSGHSPRVRQRAFDRGKLAAWCPFYWGSAKGYSTRGNQGQMFAYSARYLGRCVPRDMLDMPLYSALGAGLRARRICRDKYNEQSREIRRGQRIERTPCTAIDIRREWAGKGKDRETVRAKWIERMAFWRPRARWRTDWSGRCQGRRKDCSEELAARPTLADFRSRARGEKPAW